MGKSTTKPDQKGGIKPPKKSSTLASIMKSGGVSGAAVGKTIGKGKQVKVHGSGSKNGGVWKHDDEDVIMSTVEQGEKPTTVTKDMDMTVEGLYVASRKDTVNGRDKTEEDEVTIVGVQSPDGRAHKEAYETVNKDATEQEIVFMWEKEVKELEQRMELAETEHERSEVRNQLGRAQVLLKEALIRLSVSQKGGGNKIKEVADEPGNQDKQSERSYGKNEDNKLEEKGDSQRGVIQKAKTAAGAEYHNAPAKTTKEGIRWADMSDDDDTVTSGEDNRKMDTVTKWKVVGNKHFGKKGGNSTGNSGSAKEGGKDIENPYLLPRQHTSNKTGRNAESIPQRNQPSLVSYLETVKGNMRKENDTAIRFTFSFTPRTTGAGEFIRIAKDLLMYAKQFDPDVLMLPWSNAIGQGPINVDDLENPKNMVDKIKYYFNKPGYINIQQGTPAFGIGIRLSTNMAKFEFYNRWNAQKRVYKDSNRVAYSISFAPSQKSASAYIIGIAVGSTENQDYELLNKKLEEATGITGIEVSFQNIHQIGVTQDFWDIANKKASITNRDKYSREHLRTKYQWAPNAIAIYVPSKEKITSARKIMLQKFGKSVNGEDPIWPDGSSMRFLPIKGRTIKSEKTKAIVRKRMAFHIWLKAHETSIDTNITNIHKSIDAFEGKTFAEVILEHRNDQGSRIFRHFNRAWSNDLTKERWALSVHQNMVTEAHSVLNNLKDELYNKYGAAIEEFFIDLDINTKWSDVVQSRSQVEEEDDDWFDDEDDIDDLIKQGVVYSSFIHFLTGKADDDDKQSVASWGTGHTAYTEIVTTQETSTGTVQSSITTDQSNLPTEEKERRIDIVCARLRMKGITEEEIQDISNKKEPYGLAFSGINLPSWDADTEVLLIMALRSQNQSKQNHDERIQ